jgi:putative endonuclease
MQHELYIGFTSDLKKRMNEHQNGMSPYTRKSPSWKLVYYEAYEDVADARTRESHLKQFGSAYGHLKKRIARSLRSRKGGMILLHE